MGSIDHLRMQTVKVKRATRTSSGGGLFPTTFSLIGTARVHIRPASGQERMRAEAEEARITHVLYAAANANIQRKDTIVDTSEEEFEVLQVLKRRRPRDVTTDHLEVQLQSTQVGP